MAIDEPFKRKRGRPARSCCADTSMDQKMVLVNQGTTFLDSSSESDKDDDFQPMDDDLSVVITPRHVAINCGETDSNDEDEFIPIKIVRPRRVQRNKRKLPTVPQTDSAKIARSRRVWRNQRKLPGVPQTDSAKRISTGIQTTTEESDVDGHQIHASVDDNWESAMSRAEEMQAKLPIKHPSFVKRMLQSHVVRGFWLGLPKHFSEKHLPKREAGIVLEDENGEDHHTTYLEYKQGLSAGWRGIAIYHGLKVGDVVVFELVKSTKFKVYIVRANEFATKDVNLNLLKLDARKKGKQSKEESSEGVISEEDAKSATHNRDVPASGGSSAYGIGLDSDIDFDDVTSLGNVNVILDCLATDSEFNDHLRWSYYELCCSQRSLLHKNLLKQLHPTLVMGVIMETVSIAEGIRAYKAQSSSHEDLLVWKKTLESFEHLGMNVAFLLKRVNALLGLTTRSRESSEWQQKYKELKLERACAGKKMQVLELQLSNAKAVLHKVDAEVEELETSLMKSNEALQELASAPW